MVLPTANWQWYDHLESISYAKSIAHDIIGSFVWYDSIQFHFSYPYCVACQSLRKGS